MKNKYKPKFESLEVRQLLAADMDISQFVSMPAQDDFPPEVVRQADKGELLAASLGWLYRGSPVTRNGDYLITNHGKRLEVASIADGDVTKIKITDVYEGSTHEGEGLTVNSVGRGRLLVMSSVPTGYQKQETTATLFRISEDGRLEGLDSLRLEAGSMSWVFDDRLSLSLRMKEGQQLPQSVEGFPVFESTRDDLGYQRELVRNYVFTNDRIELETAVTTIGGMSNALPREGGRLLVNDGELLRVIDPTANGQEVTTISMPGDMISIKRYSVEDNGDILFEGLFPSPGGDFGYRPQWGTTRVNSTGEVLEVWKQMDRRLSNMMRNRDNPGFPGMNFMNTPTSFRGNGMGIRVTSYVDGKFFDNDIELPATSEGWTTGLTLDQDQVIIVSADYAKMRAEVERTMQRTHLELTAHLLVRDESGNFTLRDSKPLTGLHFTSSAQVVDGVVTLSDDEDVFILRPNGDELSLEYIKGDGQSELRPFVTGLRDMNVSFNGRTITYSEPGVDVEGRDPIPKFVFLDDGTVEVIANDLVTQYSTVSSGSEIDANGTDIVIENAGVELPATTKQLDNQAAPPAGVVLGDDLLETPPVVANQAHVVKKPTAVVDTLSQTSGQSDSRPAVIAGTVADPSVSRRAFDVDDFRRAVRSGVGGNKISAMLNGAAIVRHGSSLESYVPANDPSLPWVNRSSVAFDVSNIWFEVAGNELVVSGADVDIFGKLSHEFKSLYAVTDTGSLELVDTLPADGAVRENGPSQRILYRQASTQTDAELSDAGFQGVVITDPFNVAYDGTFDLQVLFGDANGFGDRIDVRSSARMIGPISEQGFALLSADFDADSKFFLIKANATGGELIASFNGPDGFSGPRDLKILPDGSFDVLANFYFGSDPSKRFGTLTITADGEFASEPVRLDFDEGLERMRKSLRSGTMSPSGDMQVIRGSSTLRIETIAGDRLQEQIVEGLPEVSFGRGMGGRGGTYITQDGAILTLSADIQGIVDDPSIQFGASARSLVYFEAFAQLLVADAAGQYHVVDTVSLGEQKAGSYGEFLSSGLLTLQNPNGRVTTVSIRGQTLSVNQINSPQGSRVVSLPNELLVVQGDDLSRWSLEKASQFENADVIFADFDPYDVNEDGYVTALDALVVINLLNRGVGQSEPLPSLLSLMPSADTNGDGVVSALDALRIINRLNESDQVLPAGETFTASDAAFQQMRHDRTTDNDVTNILAQNEPLLF